MRLREVKLRLVFELGEGWWMFVSGLLVFGFVRVVQEAGELLFEARLSVSLGSPPVALGGGQGTAMDLAEGFENLPILATAWVFLALHRLGIVLGGIRRCPPEICLEIPGVNEPARISYPLTWRMYLWLMLVILLGLAHPAEARHQGEAGQDDQLVGEAHFSREVAIYREEKCLAGVSPVEECVGWIWMSMCGVAIIALWETLKKCWCRRQSRTAEVQTAGMNIVPMPLAQGVPHRAQILFNLWKSGYEISVEEYPVDVQERYFGYLGDYLRGQAVEGDSSEDQASI